MVFGLHAHGTASPAPKKPRVVLAAELVPDEKSYTSPQDMDWSCRNWICVTVAVGNCNASDDGGLVKTEHVSLAYGDAVADQYPTYRKASSNATGNFHPKELGLLLADVRKVVRAGGRLAMHNLDQNKMVIKNELRNAGLSADFWLHAAANGLCTMDSAVGDWIFGVGNEPPPDEWKGPSVYNNHFSLDRLAKATLALPNSTCKHQGKLCWFVLRELYRRAGAQTLC